MIRRLFFGWRYLTGQTPWDTGITPPEIVRLIEDENLPAGRAIDLGCGTGTNVIYLAKHGWQATGIDFVASAISEAQRKARREGVAAATQFISGDVSRLDEMELDGPFDLAVDIGCGHGLLPQDQQRYARALGTIMRPGGVLMAYMFRPTPQWPRGLAPEAVEALFVPAFRLVWSNLGTDRSADQGSAWYRFERVEAT